MKKIPKKKIINASYSLPVTKMPTRLWRDKGELSSLDKTSTLCNKPRSKEEDMIFKGLNVYFVHLILEIDIFFVF